jgi:hypothetical protein
MASATSAAAMAPHRPAAIASGNPDLRHEANHVASQRFCVL